MDGAASREGAAEVAAEAEPSASAEPSGTSAARGDDAASSASRSASDAADADGSSGSAPSAPSRAPPSAAAAPHPPDAPDVDPAEPFRWVHAVASDALSRLERAFVDEILLPVLPLALELAGDAARATRARETLLAPRDHPGRASLVAVAGLVCLALLALVGWVAHAPLTRLSLRLGRLVADALGGVAEYASAVFWRPKWFGSFTFPILLARRRTFRAAPWLSQAWPHLVFFYFTGGGFWGYFGVALVALVYGATRLSYVFNCALFLIIKATLAQTWWIFASRWIKAPAALFLSLVWSFLAYLALRASVEADERRARDFHLATEGAILSAAVPPDAEDPEVRRVLACAEYFSVLEVPVTADEREVKRSYKRKALRLHPDKCRDTKYAAEAFERVKLAFETLGDARARERYEAALLRAREIAAAMAREQQGEGGGAGAAGGAGPRRRPAPRSHGPKGRRRK